MVNDFLDLTIKAAGSFAGFMIRLTVLVVLLLGLPAMFLAVLDWILRLF